MATRNQTQTCRAKGYRMVRNFKNGDIATSGRQFLTGKAETALNVQYRLRLFRGEYFLDATDGTPWFQAILGKTLSGIAEVNIKQRILRAPRVFGIRKFDYATDRNQRKITVSAIVVDQDSELVKVGLENEEIV